MVQDPVGRAVTSAGRLHCGRTAVSALGRKVIGNVLLCLAGSVVRYIDG